MLFERSGKQKGKKKEETRKEGRMRWKICSIAKRKVLSFVFLLSSLSSNFHHEEATVSVPGAFGLCDAQQQHQNSKEGKLPFAHLCRKKVRGSFSSQFSTQSQASFSVDSFLSHIEFLSAFTKHFTHLLSPSPHSTSQQTFTLYPQKSLPCLVVPNIPSIQSPKHTREQKRKPELKRKNEKCKQYIETLYGKIRNTWNWFIFYSIS